MAFVGNGVDIIDGIDQRRELGGIQPQAGEVVIRQGTGQGRVVLLNMVQRRINFDGDIVLLGVLQDIRPATLLWQIEHVVLGVEIHHIDKVSAVLLGYLRLLNCKLVADKFQEDQTQDNVLVLRGFNTATQLIGGVPESFFKAFLCGLGGGLLFYRGGHRRDRCNELEWKLIYRTMKDGGVLLLWFR